MKTVNAATAAVLEWATRNLVNPGDEAVVDNAAGSFMALHVQRLGDNCFRFGHYVSQNGDLCPDPEMVFWRSPLADHAAFGPAKAWVPVEVTMLTGYRQVAVEFKGGQPSAFSPRAGAEQASFAAMWMKNAKWQQEINLRSPSPAIRTAEVA